MASMCAVLFPVNALLESGMGKVFPHDEYCMHFCTPYVKRNLAELKKINKLEGAKRVIRSLEHLLHKEQLGTLELFSMRKR